MLRQEIPPIVVISALAQEGKQYPPTTPGSVTGLFRAPWRVTDRVEIPPHAVSGYYEAKLETVSGAYAGAVGSDPLIVRQSPAAPASAVLVQVPVNT
jgi:hypothetical protein